MTTATRPLPPAPEGALQARGLVERVLGHARRRPGAPALISGESGETLTYGELARRAGAAAARLDAAGLGPGDRVLLAAAPSSELYAALLAALARGAVAVAVDGRRGLRAALAERPAAAALAGGLLEPRPPFFRRWGDPVDPLVARELPPGAPAVRSLTSGTGGRAKAVERSHGCLAAQHTALGRLFPPFPGERSLTFFPLVALHDLCSGVASVLPPAGWRDLERFDPAAFPATVERIGVTSISAPPAVLERVVEHCGRAALRFPAVRRVVAGGGPVPRRLAAGILSVFPQADARVVYGSTEVEPIAQVAMAEVADAEGAGYLVGRPVPGLEVRRIGPLDEPGEVVVRGAHAAGCGWRRTGDLARVDADGRLWLVGRVDAVVWQRDGEVHPYEVESEVEDRAPVRRAALVTHPGAPEGELAIEVREGAGPAAAAGAARSVLDARGLGNVPVRLVRRIPLDRRQRSKVDRPALRRALARGWPA